MIGDTFLFIAKALHTDVLTKLAPIDAIARQVGLVRRVLKQSIIVSPNRAIGMERASIRYSFSSMKDKTTTIGFRSTDSSVVVCHPTRAMCASMTSTNV